MTDADTLEELPRNQVPRLLEKLKNRWPDNIAVFLTIQVSLDWVKKGSDMKLQILVPSTGAEEEGSVVFIQDRPTAYRILLQCPEKKEEALLDALFGSRRIVWSREPEFCRIPRRIADMLDVRLRDKGIPHDVDYNTYFWLPIEEATHKLPFISPPDDMVLRPLTMCDAITLSDNYSHWSPGTFDLTKDIIAFNVTQGLFKKDGGELVGWCVQSQWGSIGQLMVLSNYRRRGLAKILISQMAQLIANQGCDPYCNILVDNQASIGLFKGLGFVEFGRNSYLKCKS